MFFYELESVEERRARKQRDIKALFQQLTIVEGMSFMEAYEAVGYRFYLSDTQIRAILANMNKKCWKPAPIIQQKPLPLHRLSENPARRCIIVLLNEILIINF